PEGAGAKAAVLLLEPKPPQGGEPGGELERLTGSGHIVMRLSTRPSPAGAEELKSPYLGSSDLLSLRAAMVGHTILGVRVDDPLRGLDWLLSRRDVDPARITVYGAGPLGVVALHAAALDPRIRRLTLEGALTSYRMIVDQPTHRNAPEVMPAGV